MVLNYKLNKEQIEEINGKCVIENGKKFYVKRISPLAYGHLFYLTCEDGFPHGSYCVTFNNNKDRIKVEVLPKCGVSNILETFLNSYLDEKRKHK